MPSIQDDIRDAMQTGSGYEVELDPSLNDKSPGPLDVYLHETATGAKINLDREGGEAAKILWLPWQQGSFTQIQPNSIQEAAPGTLFFTYYLTGCKVLALQPLEPIVDADPDTGEVYQNITTGPIWHIDAPIDNAEIWHYLQGEEWISDYWPVGSSVFVSYLHRAGQNPDLWDLSAYIENGGTPTTYGQNNIGQATLGGISSGEGTLDLYFQSSPWKALKSYRTQRIK